LQPDYDADWADDASVGASVRRPSLKFESRTATSPQLLVAALPEEARRGGPRFGNDAPAAQPVDVAVPKDNSTATPDLPPGVRVPMWTPADSKPAPTGVDAQMPWRTLITLLVLALFAGGVYLAYPRAHTWWIERSVPADLHAFVEGNGVQYAPVGQGYSARLPKLPVSRDGVTPSGTSFAAMHRSIASGADYQIVVRVGQLRPDATLPFGLVGALVDPSLAGVRAPANVHSVEFDGGTAYDFDLPASLPHRGRIFRHGSRVYVVTVQSEGSGYVFDELMRSFKLAA
jgi:hypothetical protein